MRLLPNHLRQTFRHSIQALLVALTFNSASTSVLASPESAATSDHAMQQSQNESIYIAVASNFKETLSALVSAFNQQRSLPIDFRLSSGATGALYAQILHGAPFDLFFAADELRPQKLAEQMIGDATTLTTYASGQLAIAVAKQTSTVSWNNTAAGPACWSVKWDRTVTTAGPRWWLPPMRTSALM